MEQTAENKTFRPCAPTSICCCPPPTGIAVA